MIDDYAPLRRHHDRAPLSACERQAKRECYWYIISAVISIASSAAQANQTKKQGDAQARYQEEIVKVNNEQTGRQQEALRIQEDQRSESLARDANKALMLSRAEQAAAEVVASTAGIEGASVAALSQSYEASRGRYVESVNRQTAFNTSGSAAQIDATGQQANYSNLQINAPVKQTNWAALGVKTAGEVAGAYHSYKTAGKGP